MITLALIGFVGDLVTGISPCVLPVLPVIFLGHARRLLGVRPLRHLDGHRLKASLSPGLSAYSFTFG
jgi:cytochrome c biogenesis protein CcdA